MPPEFDIPLFRTQFPEFANDVTYPTPTIQVWVGLAAAMVNFNAWGSQYTLGVSLYVAHELVMAANARQTAQYGGAPGVFGGVANNKTVGKGTVSYDSQSTSEKDAGYYNLTNYGKQLWRLSRIFGAGCIQL
jgi:Protein of unknown function (DUF4054)